MFEPSNANDLRLKAFGAHWLRGGCRKGVNTDAMAVKN
jgi:hypothetical protein